MIDANPVHLASGRDLLLADDRDVVLGRARHRARAAARARGEVDRHAPLVSLVGMVGVHRERPWKAVHLMVDDGRLVRVLLERRDPDGHASFHQMVLLRRREQVAVAGLRDLEAAAEPRGVGGAKEVGVERLGAVRGGADPAGQTPAVAEKHRDGLRGMAGDPEHGHARGVAAIAQLDHVAVAQAAFPGELRADPRRRVPRDLRQRLGQLLEPAVVREAAVPDRRIGPEDDLEPSLRRGGGGWTAADRRGGAARPRTAP